MPCYRCSVTVERSPGTVRAWYSSSGLGLKMSRKRFSSERTARGRDSGPRQAGGAWGSNESLQVVKRLFRARKAGHTGSLDRLASGLLRFAWGRRPRYRDFCSTPTSATKRASGSVCARAPVTPRARVLETRDVPQYPTARLEEVLSEFVGEIEQIPPMHSAIKHQGQRLYKLAHRGHRSRARATPNPDPLRNFARCAGGTHRHRRKVFQGHVHQDSGRRYR